MRRASAPTSLPSLSPLALATLRAVIIQPASTYGFAHASTSGVKAYLLSLSHLTRAAADLASRTTAWNPATHGISCSTFTSGAFAPPAPGSALLLHAQPTPPDPLGALTVLISGLVRSYRNGNASLPDSLSVGWVGDGTRK